MANRSKSLQNVALYIDKMINNNEKHTHLCHAEGMLCLHLVPQQTTLNHKPWDSNLHVLLKCFSYQGVVETEIINNPHKQHHRLKNLLSLQCHERISKYLNITSEENS
jgi:hypothetical protein